MKYRFTITQVDNGYVVTVDARDDDLTWDPEPTSYVAITLDDVFALMKNIVGVEVTK